MKRLHILALTAALIGSSSLSTGAMARGNHHEGDRRGYEHGRDWRYGERYDNGWHHGWNRRHGGSRVTYITRTYYPEPVYVTRRVVYHTPAYYYAPRPGITVSWSSW